MIARERVNARLKLIWGADDGNVSGARRPAALALARLETQAVKAVRDEAVPQPAAT